jgi:hypothetical protein
VAFERGVIPCRQRRGLPIRAVVVLDDHVLTDRAERLRSVRADMTVIGGRVAFERTDLGR